MSKVKLTSTTPRNLEQLISWLLVMGGTIGLICSFIISYDKEQILINPAFQPGCNINPIVSCGGVMRSAQGTVFGFPNPWIGLAGFGVLITIGMAMLASAKFKRWFWLGLEAGCILGMAFAYWLLFQSVYRIHALCPFCLVVDVVVTIIFWYVTLHILQTTQLKLLQHKQWVRTFGFIRHHHIDILVGWILVVTAVILHHFWYYFGQHLF